MRSPRFGAVVILVAAVASAACARDEAAQPAPRPVLVMQPSAAGPGASAFAGEVRAREESRLGFQVAGKLLERRVDVGDHVRAGQVLAVLDAGDLQAQARAAQAQVGAAQAELDRARADRERYAQLAKQRLVSASALDAHNAAAVAAQGQVTAARATLEVARNQAGYTRLRAPSDGVIASRDVEVGQVVAAGQAVLGLAADGAREVAFAVPEGTVTVRPGQPVQVSVWSQPGRQWPGVVREVAPAADPASRTFAVRVTVQAPAAALQLGQSARVVLAGDAAAGLDVPLSALQRSGAQVAVFVVDKATSTLKLRPVRIGRYGSDTVPVTDGLQAGEWIVAAGGHLLRAGQQVAPVDRDNRRVVLAAPPVSASK